MSARGRLLLLTVLLSSLPLVAILVHRALWVESTTLLSIELASELGRPTVDRSAPMGRVYDAELLVRYPRSGFDADEWLSSGRPTLSVGDSQVQVGGALFQHWDCNSRTITASHRVMRCRIGAESLTLRRGTALEVSFVGFASLDTAPTLQLVARDRQSTELIDATAPIWMLVCIVGLSCSCLAGCSTVRRPWGTNRVRRTAE